MYLYSNMKLFTQASWKRKYKHFFKAQMCVYASYFLANQVLADTLQDLWKQILIQEPTYLSSTLEQKIAEQSLRQVVGTNYPSIKVTGDLRSNRRHQTPLQNTSSRIRLPSTHEDYNSRNWSLQIRQTLLKPALNSSIRQGKLSVALAIAKQASTEQELALKLFDTWLDVLKAQNKVEYIDAQLDGAVQQTTIYQVGEQLGSYSKVQVQEAWAKHRRTLAEQKALLFDLRSKKSKLIALLGRDYPLQWETPDLLPSNDALAWLPTHVPTPQKTRQVKSPYQESDLLLWTDLTHKHNALINEAKLKTRIAEIEIKKQSYSRLPTIDIVSDFSYTKQGAGSSAGQRGYEGRSSYVGLQINAPIFEGGILQARVDEAQWRFKKAEQDEQVVTREVTANVEQAWLNMQANFEKQSALQAQLIALKQKEQVAVQGEEVGLRTKFDILRAREEIAEAQYDKKMTFYDYLSSRFRLRLLSGELSIDRALADVDSVFFTKTDLQPKVSKNTNQALIRTQFNEADSSR